MKRLTKTQRERLRQAKKRGYFIRRRGSMFEAFYLFKRDRWRNGLPTVAITGDEIEVHLPEHTEPTAFPVGSATSAGPSVWVRGIRKEHLDQIAREVLRFYKDPTNSRPRPKMGVSPVQWASDQHDIRARGKMPLLDNVVR
jgi:hypothetical protein